MFLQKCEIDVIQNVDKMLLGITVKNVEIKRLMITSSSVNERMSHNIRNEKRSTFTLKENTINNNGERGHYFGDGHYDRID